jgi:hypothetical protein
MECPLVHNPGFGYLEAVHRGLVVDAVEMTKAMGHESGSNNSTMQHALIC